MKKQVTYFSEGRSGHILYKEDTGCLKMYYEFGGGDCVAIIFLPDDKEWGEFSGGEKRNEVLTFIANQVIKDQAPNCSYRITERFIEIFRQ